MLLATCKYWEPNLTVLFNFHPRWLWSAIIGPWSVWWLETRWEKPSGNCLYGIFLRRVHFGDMTILSERFIKKYGFLLFAHLPVSSYLRYWRLPAAWTNISHNFKHQKRRRGSTAFCGSCFSPRIIAKEPPKFETQMKIAAFLAIAHILCKVGWIVYTLSVALRQKWHNLD